jgi:hypothetical protein
MYQLDDMRRAFILRGAVVTALVHGDTGSFFFVAPFNTPLIFVVHRLRSLTRYSSLADVIVSSLSVWDSFISDAHAAYPKVFALRSCADWRLRYGVTRLRHTLLQCAFSNSHISRSSRRLPPSAG